MRSKHRSRAGSARMAGLTLLFLALSGSPVHASPDTLRLAIEDLLFGVGDVAASPVTGGITTVQNMPAVSDNGVLQALYVAPGWVGLTVLHAMQGVLRSVTGAVLLLPGLALFPFPADVPEGFNVFRQRDPLIDLENPLGDHPAWLAYVLPITPLTIDFRMAPLSPWAVYESPDDATAGNTLAATPSTDGAVAEAGARP